MASNNKAQRSPTRFCFHSSFDNCGYRTGTEKLARPEAQLETKQMRQVDSSKEFREDFIKTGEDYKALLQKLLALYENDLKKLNEHSAKFKELYTYGLISRQEYLKTTVEITEAQVKVDEVRKEIATTEITIAESRENDVSAGYTGVK